RLSSACAPSRTAAEISCIFWLPASAAMTDWVAQMPYAMASRPQAIIPHKTVIELSPFPREASRRTSLPCLLMKMAETAGFAAGPKRRGHCQKPRGDAMVWCCRLSRPQPLPHGEPGQHGASRGNDRQHDHVDEVPAEMSEHRPR